MDEPIRGMARSDRRKALEAEYGHPICVTHGERPWKADIRTAPACDVCGRSMDHWARLVVVS